MRSFFLNLIRKVPTKFNTIYQGPEATISESLKIQTKGKTSTLHNSEFGS